MATAPDPAPPDETGSLPGRRPVAFVLSGGGNLGALQIGMLRALLEHGVVPDLVVGCSVGAINGAGFADAPTIGRLADLERVWLGLDRRNLLPSGWSNAVSLARRGEAIHDLSGLRAMAQESLRAATFEELAVPFECVATDAAGVREVWFDSGPLIEPILASAALPAIYPAVEIDGVRYLDGGIVNDVPMSRAVERGAATIYILQVGSFMRSRRETRRPLDVAVQAYWVARHHRFKRELEALPPDVDVHVLPTGETPRVRFNDFTHSATLIARAHEAATAYLDDLAAGRQPESPIDRLPAAVTAPTPAVPRAAVPSALASPAPLPLPLPLPVGAGHGNGTEPDGSDPTDPTDPTAAGDGAGVGGDGVDGHRASARADGNGHDGASASAGGDRDGVDGDGARADGDGHDGDGARVDGDGHDGDGARADGDGDGVDGEPAGVRRWARATMLRRRIADLPHRRTPAAR